MRDSALTQMRDSVLQLRPRDSSTPERTSDMNAAAVREEVHKWNPTDSETSLVKSPNQF